MGYFDESETFKQSCPGGIKKEPIVETNKQTNISNKYLVHSKSIIIKIVVGANEQISTLN